VVTTAATFAFLCRTAIATIPWRHEDYGQHNPGRKANENRKHKRNDGFHDAPWRGKAASMPPSDVYRVLYGLFVTNSRIIAATALKFLFHEDQSPRWPISRWHRVQTVAKFVASSSRDGLM
jgi:hypothetical protein